MDDHDMIKPVAEPAPPPPAVLRVEIPPATHADELTVTEWSAFMGLGSPHR
ncbi:hypothetical protein [Piscinibacter sp. XHJ-5]|uniref:hypothetical protein n=1 Tax=Piscinibacter sp. XHJ-5 TaxID=3037797 RepID=UPI00245337E7|nr:hypothetical protein [Piscinibacter sp. XHJ-5]